MRFAIAVELAGIALVAAGLSYEIRYGAPLGYIFITTGSALTATGAVIFGKLIRRARG